MVVQHDTQAIYDQGISVSWLLFLQLFTCFIAVSIAQNSIWNSSLFIIYPPNGEGNAFIPVGSSAGIITENA